MENYIKQLKGILPLESGKLVARKIAFWASEEHSKLVQKRIKDNATISKERIAEMAGEMRAYIKVMEYASTIENTCKLWQDRQNKEN